MSDAGLQSSISESDAWLVLQGVPRKIWQFSIDDAPKILGRGQSCGIRVGDRSVSREHARIWRVDDKIMIEDLGSINGTYVNGLRVSESSLLLGDQIRIGQIIMQVKGESNEFDSGSDVQSAETVTFLGLSPAVRAAASLPPGTTQNREVTQLISALYSLGGTLAIRSDRKVIIRHLLEWMRDWTGTDHAGIFVMEEKTCRIVDHLSAKKNLPFSFNRESVRQSVQTNQLVFSGGGGSERSQTTIAVPMSNISPPGVVYAEWESAENLPPAPQELVRAATTVFEQSIRRVGGLKPAPDTSVRLIGGKSLASVREFIERAAAVDSTVLITGETGTGKELAAQEIHNASSRHKHGFVARNCGAFPESLLESELFGAEVGAFTGARKRRGVFDQADKGTLFLDEIGEMPIGLQTKLLRVLEERSFQRLGGDKTIHVDVRIIAATNRDLSKAVQESAFRQDLFYRLQVLNLDLPPLRSRVEDIEMLANHFVSQISEQHNRAPMRLSESALEQLRRHSWPGNVRELRNTIERAVIFSQKEVIEAGNIILSGFEGLPTPISDRMSLEDLEEQHIRSVIESVGGNKVEAAKILGIDRTTLYRKLRRLDKK